MLFGQKKFSWQDYCFFNNPAAPFCPEQEAIMAIKPGPKQAPSAPSKAVINNVFTPPEREIGEADEALWSAGSIGVSRIRFRRTGPGFDLGSLSASPLARTLVNSLGAKAGLKESDVQKLFDNLADVDQAAFSVKGERVVVMITGAYYGVAVASA